MAHIQNFFENIFTPNNSEVVDEKSSEVVKEETDEKSSEVVKEETDEVVDEIEYHHPHFGNDDSSCENLLEQPKTQKYFMLGSIFLVAGMVLIKFIK
jgi:hypothetical protein